MHDDTLFEDRYLDDTWVMYYHASDDEDWTTKSYARLHSIGSVVDYACTWVALRDRVASGILFLMREGVFPCWDDKNNIRGGCLSMKVPLSGAADFWHELCVRTLGDTLVVKERREEDEDAGFAVNGLSASPKTHFAIFKLWLREDADPDPKTYDLPPGLQGDVLYKSNMDTIHHQGAVATTTIGERR